MKPKQIVDPIKSETMKTSLLLLIAILLNTTLLMAEPLSTLVRHVDPLILILLEGILILGYFANGFFRDFSKAVEIDFGHLKIFVYKKD